MGPAVGDLDRDGKLDIFIPNLGYGTLFMNRVRYFVDRTSRSGLAKIVGQYAGWGPCLFDYDNDGYLDVFVATGGAHHMHPEESVLARNVGNGQFQDVSTEIGQLLPARSTSPGEWPMAIS